MLGGVLNSLGLVVYFDSDMYLLGWRLEIGSWDFVLEYVLFEPESLYYFGEVVTVTGLLCDPYGIFVPNSFCKLLILIPSCDILLSFNPW